MRFVQVEVPRELVRTAGSPILEVPSIMDSRRQFYWNTKGLFGTDLGIKVVKALNSSLERHLQVLGVLPEAAVAAVGKHIVTSGTDPEIFATRADGSCCPAWSFLPRKEDALHYKRVFMTPSYADGVSAYLDGFQAELALSTPISCHGYLIDRVYDGLKLIHSALPKGAALAAQDIVELSHSELSAAGEHVLLGCSPSRSAYGHEALFVPEPNNLHIRFAGCHLHYGLTDGKPPAWFPEGTVVAMDKLLGVLLCAAGRGLEDPRRREYYGKAGEYRQPGAKRLEYRTPGAFLLRAPEILNLAADVGRLAFQIGLIVDGRELPIPDVQEIINSCDADAACKIIDKYSDIYLSMLRVCYGQGYGARAMTLVKTGVARHFGPEVAKNWELGAAKTFNTHAHNLVIFLKDTL